MVEGSVTDGSLVKRLVQDAEIVIHGAARNILLSTRNPRSDFEVNIGGTLNVLLAARESRGARIVYTSSASIYGNPRYLPVNEDEPPSLVSPYAVSKFSGESYCQAFYESYGVPSTVVRYSNVFGPGQDPSNPYCGVVAKFFQAVLTGEPLAIHGDGQQTRDFTFIEDAVEATLVAALSPRAVGEVFNVGTGFETSVSALAETIMQVLNQRVEIRHIDRRDIDNIRRRVLNIEKIRRMLHWVPRFTLREGLERTWQWQRRPDRARSST
jgi:UDP-glucose 4-epimerase